MEQYLLKVFIVFAVMIVLVIAVSKQIAWEFRPILSEKNLCWEMDLDSNVEIVCDPNKLERVFDNLIRNAVNYSYPQSQISLTMHSRQDDVEIQLRNHGKSIPPEKLGKIFEQFYRMDSSRDSKTGTTNAAPKNQRQAPFGSEHLAYWLGLLRLACFSVKITLSRPPFLTVLLPSSKPFRQAKALTIFHKKRTGL